jgi:hypothetical protein
VGVLVPISNFVGEHRVAELVEIPAVQAGKLGGGASWRRPPRVWSDGRDTPCGRESAGYAYPPAMIGM